jgi:hypothetical protein
MPNLISHIANGVLDVTPEFSNEQAVIRGIHNLALWILVSSVLSVIFIIIEDVTGTGPSRLGGGWAFELSFFVRVTGFNIACADILRHYIKQHKRDVTAWTTAIIIFTPVLTGIVYLLTWPGNQKLTGLDKLKGQ